MNVDKLADELAQALAEYSQEVADEIKRAADDVTKEAVSSLKKESPVRTGAYAKSWSRKTQYESRSVKRNTVYNRKKYQLTHLLEHGHASRNGGRVAPKVHIKPVEEKTVADFEKKVRGAIEK